MALPPGPNGCDQVVKGQVVKAVGTGNNHR